MNTVKFYFSEDFKVTNVEVLLGTNNTIIAVGNPISKLRRVPRVTICGIFNSEENTLTFGVSRCSNKDTFVKSIGRELSLQRATNCPYKTVHIPKNKKISDVFLDTCLEIEREVIGMTYPISLIK